MNHGIPQSWVEVDRETFDRIVGEMDYLRTGFCGEVIYRGKRTGDEFAAVSEFKGRAEAYFVHPALAATR